MRKRNRSDPQIDKTERFRESRHFFIIYFARRREKREREGGRNLWPSNKSKFLLKIDVLRLIRSFFRDTRD